MNNIIQQPVSTTLVLYRKPLMSMIVFGKEEVSEELKDCFEKIKNFFSFKKANEPVAKVRDIYAEWKAYVAESAEELIFDKRSGVYCLPGSEPWRQKIYYEDTSWFGKNKKRQEEEARAKGQINDTVVVEAYGDDFNYEDTSWAGFWGGGQKKKEEKKEEEKKPKRSFLSRLLFSDEGEEEVKTSPSPQSTTSNKSKKHKKQTNHSSYQPKPASSFSGKPSYQQQSKPSYQPKPASSYQPKSESSGEKLQSRYERGYEEKEKVSSNSSGSGIGWNFGGANFEEELLKTYGSQTTEPVASNVDVKPEASENVGSMEKKEEKKQKKSFFTSIFQ